jgi:hypothetical protein
LAAAALTTTRLRRRRGAAAAVMGTLLNAFVLRNAILLGLMDIYGLWFLCCWLAAFGWRGNCWYKYRLQQVLNRLYRGLFPLISDICFGLESHYMYMHVPPAHTKKANICSTTHFARFVVICCGHFITKKSQVTPCRFYTQEHRIDRFSRFVHVKHNMNRTYPYFWHLKNQFRSLYVFCQSINHLFVVYW